jgi:Protein of unknown function (DUF3572)
LKKLAMPSSEEAEIIALRALAFLATDADRLGRFMALCGVSPAELRGAAGNRQFLGGILTHLLQDESLLLTFTADAELDPRLPAMAAELLNGSES